MNLYWKGVNQQQQQMDLILEMLWASEDVLVLSPAAGDCGRCLTPCETGKCPGS